MTEPWTPGPWRIMRWERTDGKKQRTLIVSGTAGPTIWDVPFEPGVSHSRPSEADARLIAAAPEMAALLDALVEGFRVVGDSPDHSFDAAAFVARNAATLLARIRGESDA